MKSLGQRIREERLKQNLTLEQLSQLTKLSKSFLSQIEPDVAQLSISTLRRIARVFNISVVNLITEENTNQNNLGHPPKPKKNSDECSVYVKDVKGVRADRRKGMTLPGSNVSYQLVTPDFNRHSPHAPLVLMLLSSRMGCFTDSIVKKFF